MNSEGIEEYKEVNKQDIPTSSQLPNKCPLYYANELNLLIDL